jgi:4a-hydroxytetrahydrobiopterin dehydratase
MSLLSQDAIRSKLNTIPEWRQEEQSIVRDVELKNFMGAIEFVNQVGEVAEEMDHHPDILIHGWNKVKITVTTHSEGGLTDNDFKLASQIEQLQS